MTIVVLLFSSTVGAQTAPQSVLNLSASAQIEVTKDMLSVVLSATREGFDASVVQSGLKQALDGALVEARKVAKPGQVDIQTGSFSLYPRYNSKGGLSGWQGTAELVVKGRDMPAIAQLTARINTMTIARVGFQLSPEASDKVESELVAQAIDRYRAKAAGMARQFGYSGYAIREVQVHTQESGGTVPVPMMAEARISQASEKALPVEPGKGVVTATVSGSIQMTR
jgi:predicted secreted protein